MPDAPSWYRPREPFQPSGDPYLDELREQTRDEAAATVLRGGNPNTTGRANVLARQYAGIPADTIERNLPAFEARDRAARFSSMVERYPAMGSWLASNPRNPILAQDDTDNLGLLGGAWDVLKNAPGRIGGEGVYRAGAGLRFITDRVTDWATVINLPFAMTAQAFVDAAGLPGAGEDPLDVARDQMLARKAERDRMRQIAQGYAERSRGATWATEQILSGGASVLPSVAAAGVTVATRNPNAGLATMVAPVSGNEYERARDQGLSSTQALLYSGTQASIEAVTERLPVGYLAEVITKKVPLGKALARQLFAENIGEQVATHTQDFVSWAMLPENSNKVFADYIEERPGAALSTVLATTGSTTAQTAAATAINRAVGVTERVSERLSQARQARQEREFFDRAGKAVEGSRLRQRDPEALRSLLREQAQESGASSVFIPGEAVREFQQSDRYNPDSDPFAEYDVDEAAATGGDIVIPIADALTDLVGTPAWEALRDDMRLAPGGMSAREATTFEEAMDDVMAELGEQASRIDAVEAEQRTVREKIVDRVAEMFGVSFTSPTARTIAELFAQRVQTRASRLGQELTGAEVEGLEVRQVMPEGVATASKGGKIEDLIRALKRKAWDGPGETNGTIAAMRKRTASTKASGPSLLKWIISQGGIEDRGGDLAAMGAAAIRGFSQKGQRKIIKPHSQEQASMIGGPANRRNAPDVLFDAAITEGFFPEFAARIAGDTQGDIATEKPDVNVFLAAIADELAGNLRYAAEPIVDPVAAAAEDLRAMLEDAGLDPDAMSDIEIRAAIERMAREASEGGYEQGLFGEEQGEDPNLSDIERQKLKLRAAAPLKGRKEQDGTMGLGLFDSQRSLFQEARARVIFEDGKRIIELFQSRNLSSPLHEFSHMWLEELKADAEQPDAPEQLKADWETTKRYFAAAGHKIGKDGQIPTEAHELWARSGERYFMEGKAPTSALVRLFESFRAWLVNIYKTVDRLRAPISPEIREVFDRLLATDEEIAAVQERQGLEALFKDAASVGMSEPEFQAYQRQVDDARAGAHASLLDKTMKAIRRRETKTYQEARKAVKAEEQERIDAAPVFKALATMKEQRVNREWIVENYGADALDLLPVRVPPLYTAGGAHPDVIAEQSGYASGGQMIEALIGAEAAHRALKEGGDDRTMRARAIETATDEEMNRRYGDPLNDGSIEREALAAVHSEMQGEVIASELRVLSRKTGQRPTPYRIAREWARGKIRTGTVAQEASPSAIQRYARNAAKAGRAAEAAMLKQDVDEAFRQKQFQMMNNALVAEAKEAADEVVAAVKRMDKTARTKTRKSTDQDYLEQAHVLLEAVDLKQRTEKSLALKDQFMAWAEARQAEGYDIVVPNNFEGALQTHWTRLPVETLLALDEAVKQILHLGRLKQTFLDDDKRREREEIVAEAIGGMEGMRRKPPSDLMEPSGWEWIKSGVAHIDAALLKMETVFDWLDQGNSNGAFNRVVFRPLADAQEQARVRMNDLIGQLNDAIAAIPKGSLKRWRDKFTAPELLNRETGNRYVLTREQLVSMALNMGNAGNRAKLAGGYGWDEADILAVLNRELSAEEWTYVQTVWDTIDSLWPEIEAMEKRLNGVAPEKIEATPVETPFGTLRGGYFPVVYDPRKNYEAEAQNAKGRDLFENIYTRSTTPRGFTKERTKVERPIHLSLNIISRHVAEVIHDITHREAVMQADKFLTDRRVMKAIDETLGPEIRSSFRPWLQRIANQWAYDRAGMAGVEGFLNKMRLNATVVGMGFRVTTIMVQAAGYANSFEVVGERWVAPRLKDAANPAAWKFVLEKSQEAAGRMSSLDRDISDAAKRAAGGKKLSAASRFVFHGIGLMDRVVTIPTWLGAYDKALAAGMADADAIYAADKAVRQSQGAGAAKDLAAIQAGRGPVGALAKYLTMFYSFMSAFYQRQRTLARDVRSARPRDIPRLMARAWWLLVVSPLLAELLAGRGPGDDDDDETWATWALQSIGGQFFGPIPIARDVVPVLARKLKDQSTFGYRFTPAQGGVDALLRLADNAERAYEGEETKDATRNVIEFTGYATGSGLATGQIAAATQFLVDVGSDDADPEGFGDWWEGLTTGRLKEDAN